MILLSYFVMRRKWCKAKRLPGMEEDERRRRPPLRKHLGPIPLVRTPPLMEAIEPKANRDTDGYKINTHQFREGTI